MSDDEIDGLVRIGPNDHPEPRTMMWMGIELDAIRAHTRKAVRAALEKQRQKVDALLADSERLAAEQAVMRQWIAEAVQAMQGMRLLYGYETVGGSDLIESGRRLVDGGPDDLLAGVE